jgi:hypothetical protein
LLRGDSFFKLGGKNMEIEKFNHKEHEEQMKNPQDEEFEGCIIGSGGKEFTIDEKDIKNLFPVSKFRKIITETPGYKKRKLEPSVPPVNREEYRIEWNEIVSKLNKWVSEKKEEAAKIDSELQKTGDTEKIIESINVLQEVIDEASSDIAIRKEILRLYEEKGKGI